MICLNKHRLLRLCGFALALSAIFAGSTVYYANRSTQYERYVDNQYERVLSQLLNSVDQLETSLKKAQYLSPGALRQTMAADIWKESQLASYALSALPLGDQRPEHLETYLSQVGDYTYTLSQSIIDKKSITEDEYENLNALCSYANSLNQSLADLTQKVYKGEYRFGDNGKITLEKVVYAETSDELSAIEKEFGEYPSLIYDGPFSEHIENIEPKMTKHARELTKNEAIAYAAKFFGVNAENVTYIGETQNSLMNSYMLRCVTGSGTATVSITKGGGHVVYFLNNRRIGRENVSVNDAIHLARTFLKEKGYDSMQNSYYEKTGGIATINFAYKQNEVVCYSDLIKVKVALDDGEIVGMEANGYIMNHEIRNIRTPNLSKQEARSKVSSRLSIDSANIALIPKDSKREVLCYEFKGTSGGRNFLIYINAETGREEDIQILIESPDGILTI